MPPESQLRMYLCMLQFPRHKYCVICVHGLPILSTFVLMNGTIFSDTRLLTTPLDRTRFFFHIHICHMRRSCHVITTRVIIIIMSDSESSWIYGTRAPLRLAFVRTRLTRCFRSQSSCEIIPQPPALQMIRVMD